jgi:putative endopeptidase
MEKRLTLRTLLLAAASVMAAGAVMAADAGPVVPPWGVNLSYMDTSVKPGNDFFSYANGSWVKTALIPPERAYAGVDLELIQTNDKRLRGIVDGLVAEKDADLTPEQIKLRDFYAAYIDTAQIEARGLAPAAADLARIAALKTKDEVAALMADPGLNLDGPFSQGISADAKNPAAYAIQLGQSGLGMPDRDYYLGTDKALAATREAYKTYLATMLGYAGTPDAAARAQAVFDLETELAKVSWPAADRRDADKTYNPLTLAQLTALAPDFPWSAYLSAAGVTNENAHGPRVMIIAEKSAFPGLAKVFADTPVAVWRDYLTVRYLHAFSADLPKKFDDADFAFYGTTMAGRTAQLDRPTRGVRMLDANMGEALGQIYVAKYFPPEAKAKADLLVHNLLKAYAEDIKTLSWMTPATREKALDKLSRYMLKIGYPDHWRDYSALVIQPGALIADVQAANRFEWNRQLKRIDQPVDRTEWEMTPSTVNAYYEDTLNEIVFPAAILQPPFFDPAADDAVNYGGIGATIGHEISHGFDDQGSKFDGSGTLKSWWTDEDRKNFDARTAALAAQYDQYEPLPGLHVNGKLTLGENIADLAGLVIALKAYHIALDGKPAPVLSGMTGDQRFFVAHGQSNRVVWRPALTRRIVLSDPHSPDIYRVNGVLRNVDGWYAAYPSVAPGDTYWLAPDARVRLW